MRWRAGEMAARRAHSERDLIEISDRPRKNPISQIPFRGRGTGKARPELLAIAAFSIHRQSFLCPQRAEACIIPRALRTTAARPRLPVLCPLLCECVGRGNRVRELS